MVHPSRASVIIGLRGGSIMFVFIGQCWAKSDALLGNHDVRSAATIWAQRPMYSPRPKRVFQSSSLVISTFVAIAFFVF